MKSSFLQPPEFLSLPFFGMSVSQSSIRLTKFKNNKAGYVPDIVDEVLIKETCDFFTNPNSYADCSEIIKALKDLKKKHAIHFIQLAVPEENTYVFRISIPGTIEIVEDFILNNIDQYIPLTAAEVCFDYKILTAHSTDTTTVVVVTAIPRLVIEKYTSLFESCGLFILAFEPETHAIARCVIDVGDMSPYVIINVVHQSTSISVVEEGRVQYTQTIPIKTEDIAQVSPENAKVFQESINKVIIYWFTSKDQHVQNPKIENIILTGENMQSSDLINFLESSLSVNVTFADVWKNCFDIQQYVPKISKKDSLKYATCIGLSLSNIK